MSLFSETVSDLSSATCFLGSTSLIITFWLSEVFRSSKTFSTDFLMSAIGDLAADVSSLSAVAREVAIRVKMAILSNIFGDFLRMRSGQANVLYEVDVKLQLREISGHSVKASRLGRAMAAAPVEQAGRILTVHL